MIIDTNAIIAKARKINELADMADEEWGRANAAFWALDENPDSDMEEWGRADERNTAAEERARRYEILRELAEDAVSGIHQVLQALEALKFESEGLEL